MWWESAAGNYINGETGIVLWVELTGVPDYRLRVGPTETTGVRLVGTYATEADAQEAARKLCQGIDPTTVTT
jgi:hypothetical protein